LLPWHGESDAPAVAAGLLRAWLDQGLLATHRIG
jgi:hypothetical protein